MGLYVYGALLMTMAFFIGFTKHDPILMGIAVMACAVAALSEAINDVAQSSFGLRSWPQGSLWVNCMALASWMITAIAALSAVFSLVGGA